MSAAPEGRLSPGLDTDMCLLLLACGAPRTCTGHRCPPGPGSCPPTEGSTAAEAGRSRSAARWSERRRPRALDPQGNLWAGQGQGQHQAISFWASGRLHSLRQLGAGELVAPFSTGQHLGHPRGLLPPGADGHGSLRSAPRGGLRNCSSYTRGLTPPGADEALQRLHGQTEELQ